MADLFFSSTQEAPEETLERVSDQGAALIVWNDNINTFDHVIESLIEVCDQSPEQAEQCALFIHYKGKYAVKKGEAERLRPMAEGLLDRGIQATVES